MLTGTLIWSLFLYCIFHGLFNKSSCRWFETPWRSRYVTLRWLQHTYTGSMSLLCGCVPTDVNTEFSLMVVRVHLKYEFFKPPTALNIPPPPVSGSHIMLAWFYLNILLNWFGFVVNGPGCNSILTFPRRFDYPFRLANWASLIRGTKHKPSLSYLVKKADGA